MVRRKKTKTEKWLVNQHRNNTKFSLVSPTAAQYRKMSTRDRRKVTTIMIGWNSRSPLRKANALWDMINFTNSVKDKSGNPLVKGRQKGQVLNVSNALNHLSQQRTELTERKIEADIIKRVKTSEQQRKAIKNANIVLQVGGANKNRHDMIALKRFHEFSQPKFKTAAMSNFNKNEFKTVVEDFIIYAQRSETVLIKDGSDYFGSYGSVNEAMDMIYTQLSDNYDRDDIFAKKLGQTKHGRYGTQTVFKPTMRRGKK